MGAGDDFPVSGLQAGEAMFLCGARLDFRRLSTDNETVGSSNLSETVPDASSGLRNLRQPDG